MGLIEEDQPIGIEKSLGVMLINYFQSIGAEKSLPTDKNNRVGFINRFHKQLAVDNPYWPEDYEFGFVYYYFINELMYGDIRAKGHNVQAHIEAFKQWITRDGTESFLRRKWLDKHPDQRPKELGTGSKEARQSAIDTDQFVTFTPETVQRQIKSLETIYGDMQGVLEAFPGFGSYADRLYNTKQKMIEEGNWPS